LPAETKPASASTWHQWFRRNFWWHVPASASGPKQLGWINCFGIALASAKVS
jgi:hypothetical protein